MPPKKAPSIEPLQTVDFVDFCKQLEHLAGYNQRQMAEALGVPLNTYQHWRLRKREPSGNAVARMFVLREKLLRKLNIPIPLPFKDEIEKDNTRTEP